MTFIGIFTKSWPVNLKVARNKTRIHGQQEGCVLIM